MLTHLSLFSGIGGLDLAAEWAGFETVGQCEWADYPTKILEKHWPTVPRWRDIRDLSAREFIYRTGIQPGKLTAISGGFPCQPFSVAGNQKGKEDDRYLWPQMLRVIRELHPHYIIGENVPGILHIAADDVCRDLEREGYEVGIFDYEVAAAGAPHRRERFFFLAHSRSIRCNTGSNNRERGLIHNNGEGDVEKDQPERDKWISWAGETCADVAHSNGNGCNGGIGEKMEVYGFSGSGQNAANTISERLQAFGVQGGLREEKREACSSVERRSMLGKEWPTNWWAVEPGMGRVANGVPDRVDRLKCLGNAVSPYQAFPIFKAIADIEMSLTSKGG